MSPSILKANELSSDSDFDLQKWLKEIEGAENLMNEVEAKADTLQAKVDALLLEVGQPSIQNEEKDNTITNETNEKVTKETDEEKTEAKKD